MWAPRRGQGSGSLDFLAGDGEMARLMRIWDWSTSSLGPPETWPQPLRTAVRTLLNTGHPMYIFWGADGACLYNDAYRQSLGPERHPGSLGRPAREVWEEVWDAIGWQVEQVMSGGPATWHENQKLPTTRHGRREEVYWTYSYGPIDDPAAPGGIGGVLVVCAETTETVLAEQRLAAEVARHRALLRNTPSFMAILRGADHRFEFANAAFVAMVQGRELIGRRYAEALPLAEEFGFVALLDEVYRSGESRAMTGFGYVDEGSPAGAPVERFVDFVCQPVIDAAGRITGVFIDGNDVTDRIVAMRRLQTLALVDGLTELPNRAALIAAIERAIAGQKRRGGAFALLYLDLDGFKRLNDEKGHAAGDEALREVAAALRAQLRQDDVAGRLGGDEFAAVIAGDAAEAALAAERVRAGIEGGMRARGWAVSVSIGAAAFSSPPADADAALAAADNLMYAAKAAGKNRVVVG